ncbi:helix-turn-helix transcriptional regulator [Burkholderia alba]|uniref:helix-turn-helix transcriptional regulator n=1 Tax=Burkholderia alba TaxID=2683677 RepID=UPI002B05F9C7|nr:helix-turn-helix transcriptional regulator [Burkholderia alba]
MFSSLYFPLVAYLGASEFVAEHERFGILLFKGEIVTARQVASRWADVPDNTLSLQLHADMQLVTGNGTEAEEAYRAVQRLRRSRSRQEMRVESCRNAAWQALFRHRLNTALACFGRAADESDVSPDRMLEVRVGIVFVLHELGRISEALAELEELFVLADHASACTVVAWQELLTVLKFDISAQFELRSSAALQDHVYWQSSAMHAHPVHAMPLVHANSGQRHIGSTCVRIPLLRLRADYLDQVSNATGTEWQAIDGLLKHVNWARVQSLNEYQRTLRLEVALAMLTRDAVQAVEVILEPLSSGQMGVSGHQQIEYLYCVAKTLQMQGRLQEAQQVYSRYALMSMGSVREALSSRVPFIERKVREMAQLDDIGARLPARYRRAYNFLLENLEHADLSVSDIAAEIGVTERALQGAFKQFLNMSPTELVRHLRMERIRSELVDSVDSNGKILAIGNRWGVLDRSVMTKTYRKHFDEAPSRTRK